MQEYHITLKNKKLKSYCLFTWMILVVTFAFELYFTLSGLSKKGNWVLMVLVFGVSIVVLVIRKVFRFSSSYWANRENIGYVCGFLIAPLMIWKFYLLIIILFIIIILFAIATRNFYLVISMDKIIYPSFPKKQLSWSELNNLIMKDGILTIDFKNNKLVQLEIEYDGPYNEKEFNDFCRQQLAT